MTYSEREIAQILAASGCALDNYGECLAALKHHGIGPHEIPPDWVSFRTMALDMREAEAGVRNPTGLRAICGGIAFAAGKIKDALSAPKETLLDDVIEVRPATITPRTVALITGLSAITAAVLTVVPR